MSRNLSDVLKMFNARGPQLRDVGQYVQRPPTMMRSDNTLINPPLPAKRPTTLDAIDAKSAMTHYSDDPRPSFPDTTGQKSGDLPGYLRLIKGLLVGSPEKLLSGEMSQIGGPSGPSFTYPTGLPDALAALPMFGGVMRAAKNTVKPFFSGLARTLSERAPTIGTAEHFINVARKGGKAEELAWTGLEDWLKSQPGKIRRDDVLKYVDDNVPELRERMVGEKPLSNGYRVERNDSGYYVVDRDGNNIITPGLRTQFDTAEEAAQASRIADVETSGIMRPKFTNWTLPGGENHRELVVTMPNKQNPELNFRDWAEKQYGLPQSYDFTKYGDFQTPSGKLSFDDLADKHSEYRQLINDNLTPAYDVPTGHAYGDPELDVNRLFHARMNDRTTATGERALHLDELQSDWHQAGKRAGYVGSSTPSAEPRFPNDLEFRRASRQDADSFNGIYDGNGPDGQAHINDWMLFDRNGEPIARVPHDVREEVARRQAAEIYEDVANAGGRPDEVGGVPDAPFKKTWERLGMKRMLQEAADGGYDRLTWTTGAQQADRYSLAKHVDRLRYDPATQELTGYKGRGIGPIITQKVAPADLPDYIGREMADKLLTVKLPPKGEVQYDSRLGKYFIKDENGNIGANTFNSGHTAREWINANWPQYHELTGQDLKLGGEGMRAAYDVRLPNIANDLGKKYGVRAEKVDIGGGAITADNVRKLAIGSGRRSDIIHEVARQVEETGKQPLDALRDLRALYYGGEWSITGQDYNAIRKQLIELPKNNQQVWSLKITAEMRRDLMEQGQPLFNVSPPVPLPRREKKKKKKKKRTTRDLAMWPAH